MKLALLPEATKSALAVAQMALGKSAWQPIVGHVLLEASVDGGLRVSGTDLEARAWHTIAAEVHEHGSVTLPPKALLDFLDATRPGEPFSLAVNDQHKAELVYAKTRVRIAGLDPEGFPPCPDFSDPETDLTVSADVLATLIQSVSHAVAPDGSRAVLAGILVRVRGGELTLVAADGHRLALRSVAVDAPDIEVIAQGRVLAKAVGVLSRATSARLLVDRRASMVCLDTEAGCLAVRLIEGQFPDFNRFIPRDPPIQVTVDRSDLLRAARLIRNVVTEEVNSDKRRSSTQRARLTVGADTLVVQASGTDGDQEAEIVLEAVRTRGDDLTIVFNGAYFRDAIEAIESPRVVLEMTGPASPAIVRPDGEPNGSHQHVLMPMHDARGGA